MLSTELSEKWLTVVDDGTALLGRMRGGSVDIPLLERVMAFAAQADAWLEDAARHVLQLAEVSLAGAYCARRDFDRKRHVLVVLLEELREHAATKS